MPYMLDVVILLIVAVAVFLGYRRGFVRTILQVFGCVIACALAVWLSGLAATAVFDTVLRDGIHTSVATRWDQTVSSDASATLTEQAQIVRDALPTFMQGMVSAETIEEGIKETVGNQQTAAAVADYVTDMLVRPIAVGVLRVVSFLILFVVFVILVRLLRKWIKPLTRLPLIKQADGWLGAAIGFVQGAVFAYVAVMVMQLLAVSMPSGPITAQDLDTSLIAGGIASLAEVIIF